MVEGSQSRGIRDAAAAFALWLKKHDLRAFASNLRVGRDGTGALGEALGGRAGVNQEPDMSNERNPNQQSQNNPNQGGQQGGQGGQHKPGQQTQNPGQGGQQGGQGGQQGGQHKPGEQKR